MVEPDPRARQPAAGVEPVDEPRAPAQVVVEAHLGRVVLARREHAVGDGAGDEDVLAAAALVSLVVPLAWSIGDARRLTRTDTRVVAQRWIEAHVPRGAQVLAESSTPPLPGFTVTPLALPGPGRAPDPNRSLARARGDYVLVTGAVADRVLAARDRYPREVRFYDQLRMQGKRVYHVRAGHGLTGPWVSVYRL